MTITTLFLSIKVYVSIFRRLACRYIRSLVAYPEYAEQHEWLFRPNFCDILRRDNMSHSIVYHLSLI